MKFNLIWNFEEKRNIFSFKTIRCAHLISPRCTNTYSCLFRCFFICSLWCDYDDVDDTQRSATLAMRMRFYFYFYSLFLLNISFFLFSFEASSHNCNWGLSSLTRSLKSQPFFVCYMHKYHTKLTSLHRFSLPRVKRNIWEILAVL